MRSKLVALALIAFYAGRSEAQDATAGLETLAFPHKEMAATEAILTDNGVRSQGSPDTLAVWNLKSTR